MTGSVGGYLLAQVSTASAISIVLNVSLEPCRYPCSAAIASLRISTFQSGALIADPLGRVPAFLGPFDRCGIPARRA